MPNITQWASSGLHSIQVGKNGPTGYNGGFAGVLVAAVDTQSSMRLLIGGVSAPSPLPQSTHVRNRGRDGYISDRIFDAPPNEFTITAEDFDGDLSIMLNTLTLLSLGEWELVPEGGPTTFASTNWLFSRHAISKESATDGAEGFENLYVCSSSGRYEPGNMEFQAPGSFNITATASPVTITPLGTTALASFGQQSIYTMRWFSEYPCSITTHIGNNAETSISLGFTPISTAKTKAYNFATGAALTVSSVDVNADTATLSAAPASGAITIVIYETTDI